MLQSPPEMHPFLPSDHFP
ncbi:hypothetical protein SOVF_018440, partial [Spinacia oleracea]